MKFLNLSIALLSINNAANAFMPSNVARFGAETALNLQRPDSSGAVQEALEASRKFGSTSSEARIAWEVVEELDASDNSIAYKGLTMASKKWSESVPDSEENLVKNLNGHFEHTQDLLQEIKQEIFVKPVDDITSTIANIKIKSHDSSVDAFATAAEPSGTSMKSEKVTHPSLMKAISMAELMTEWYGIRSKEARLAWETVEDISSNGFEEAVKGEIKSGEECLVELMDACEAMEELDRALFSNKEVKSEA